LIRENRSKTVYIFVQIKRVIITKCKYIKEIYIKDNISPVYISNKINNLHTMKYLFPTIKIHKQT